ncbi:A24 family peptidase [Curtobacterium sp. MCPF17_046]|uniref:prepilin peptidase n=1 Tax=Curtobacterium sp. MCPF17_046 TaxID=2175663 RepID=UPI000D967A4B|nr:A24 family peptidase [Curtobacterium sp. MCPF17_046]PYY41531.1 prepilin peptidase [Curtobacterium sp. MCPF17_046]
MTALFTGSTAVLGLLIGSFLNVVVYRVPAGMSVARPASACPRCGHEIRGIDNVPVLSWLVLRGRCRDCSAPISVRYPAVELTTAVLFGVVALAFAPAGIGNGAAVGRVAVLSALLYLMAASVALALIDLDTHRLPNAIVLQAYAVLAVLLSGASVLTGDWGALVRAVVGLAGLGGVYLVLALAVPGGMGLGDVKLAGVLGFVLAYLGWGPLAVGASAAFLLGGTFSIVLLLSGRAGRRSGIPFGPWMLAGAWTGIFLGPTIWAAYLGALGLG